MRRRPYRSGFSMTFVGIAMLIGILIGQSTGVLNESQSANEDFAAGNITADDNGGNFSLAQQATNPPNTPLATMTPSRTLLPPPTFQPPTITPTPSNTPTITPTTFAEIQVDLPGLNGLPSPTSEATAHCEPREDWHLTYTVQRDDALDNIAAKYGTYAETLAQGNCLEDKNLIRIGQVLRVPGDAAPQQSNVQCAPFEVLTPAYGSTVPADGLVTFNWRGPLATRNLLRILRPDGTYYEETLEFRQNQQINVTEHLGQGGTYTWWVFPLDTFGNTVMECPMGGPWVFTKNATGS